MKTIHGLEIDNSLLSENLDRITNQIFKLLPMYEEEQDWQKPLETLIIELSGFNGLFKDNSESVRLLFKMQGLLESSDIDFMAFRRTIFECCSLAGKIKTHIV